MVLLPSPIELPLEAGGAVRYLNTEQTLPEKFYRPCPLQTFDLL